MKIWERAGALVAAAGVVAATACAPHAGLLATSKDATVARTMSSGHDDDSAWGITRVGDKWQVSLRLSEPAPMRDTPPLLAVDGRVVGAARESGDRRTLTVLTDDPSIKPGGRVSLWSPADETAGGASSPSAPATPHVAGGATVAHDPGVTGPFAVAESEYDFGDEAITLSGLDNHKAELRAKVYAPQGTTGKRPLVLFLHGRHEPCFGDQPEDFFNPWPCAPGNHPVPSHRGYDVPARALASNGYVVASISADAINAWDFDVTDGGALARAQLVLAHLDLWQKWATTGGAPYGTAFKNKVDLSNVGLMGHSRGGEGVVRAALLNSARKKPYGIRAVVALAPTDFARPTIPGVATSVILPYCDGDVLDLQGQHYFDDTRYAVAGDDAIRSTVLIQGTNHNFFNTEWTPGISAAPSFDDWFGDPNAQPCGAQAPQRLHFLEQLAAGRAYIAGWFRMILGRDPSLLPLFDGSGTRAPSAGRAVADAVVQMPSDARRDLARLESSDSAVSVSGAASARRCSGIEFPFGPPASTLPACSDADSSQTPHWTPAFLALGAPMPAVTKLAWTGTGGRLRISLSARTRDLHKYTALTVRAAPDPKSGPVDLTVRLTDGNGKVANVVASNVSNALQHLSGNDFGLPKVALRELRIPLASVKNLVSLRDVRTIDFLTNRVSTGSVFLSDVTATRASIGRTGPITLPRLSTNDVTVQEGDSGRRVLRFRINLSRPVHRQVRVHVDAANDFFGDPALTPVSRTLVYEPGQTTKTVAVTVNADTFDNPDRVFSVVLSIPKEAILDRSIATGTVVDDDEAPTISIGAATATEHEGVVKFPLTLSRPAADIVFVDAQINEFTARFGSDIASGNEMFGLVEAGQTHGELDVAIVDDNVPEPTEAFQVHVLATGGADLTGPENVVGTILDDD